MERILIFYPHEGWVNAALSALKGQEVKAIMKYAEALKHLEESGPYDAVCCGWDDKHTIPIFEKALQLSPKDSAYPHSQRPR